MDTRSKILSPERALQLASETRSAGKQLKIVSGFFDVLQPEIVRALTPLAGPESLLLALVLDPPSPVTSATARAELAASLRMIDYVVSFDGDPTAFIERMQPAEWIQHEHAHAESTRRLLERVRRQSH